MKLLKTDPQFANVCKQYCEFASMALALDGYFVSAPVYIPVFGEPYWFADFKKGELICELVIAKKPNVNPSYLSYIEIYRIKNYSFENKNGLFKVIGLIKNNVYVTDETNVYLLTAAERRKFDILNNEI